MAPSIDWWSWDMAETCAALLVLAGALIWAYYKWGGANSSSSGLGLDFAIPLRNQARSHASSERRTDRVNLELPIIVFGKDLHGEEFDEVTRTVTLSGYGASIVLNRQLKPGQEIVIRRTDSREARCRVVGLFGRQSKELIYGIAFIEPEVDLWDLCKLLAEAKDASRAGPFGVRV
jgi:hypothetical protein